MMNQSFWGIRIAGELNAPSRPGGDPYHSGAPEWARAQLVFAARAHPKRKPHLHRTAFGRGQRHFIHQATPITS
jgi:hypothetical protein